MKSVEKLSHAFSKKFISPKSIDKDIARREYVLNILLVGLIFLSAIAFSINLTQYIMNFATGGSANPTVSGGILILFCILLAISRYGKSRIAAYIFVILLTLIGVYLNYYYGADLPVMLLFFALVIVIAGILINTKVAFRITFMSGVSILLFTHLESIGFLQPNNMRKIEPIHMVDSVVHVIILGIIAVASWLFNREMGNALKRAKESESALKKQRDQLEIIVAERTQELKQTQVEKLMQLYRFAEFGKLSSGLLHELVAPLNLISLNLEQARKNTAHTELQEKVNKSLERAILGTERLENYLQAARKQIQSQDISQEFSLNEEIHHVLDILEYKAKKENIKIVFNEAPEIIIYGNPLKLNQLITNIVLNGIDAYDNVHKVGKKIEIVLKQIKDDVVISIQDWGSGIDSKHLPKIYDPLFTTKSLEKGTGIGLSLCKDIIEKDFKGKIYVKSKLGVGTVFTLRFTLRSK